nr:MAG TPA: hypothetical protein [Caudoviricetes sp.]
MVTILKVIAVNEGGRTSYYPTQDDGVFPTVDMAREFYKNEFKANRIILCYVNK